MTRVTWGWVLLLCLPGGASARQGEEVDRIFQAWNAKDRPGCAVGVARAGGTILSRAYGMADLEREVPNTPETVFEAGSVSKQFTAAAAVLLAEDGRLSLDDDVRRYLPELPDYGTPIMIRHLLNHTSGLRDWGGVAAIAGWSRGVRAHTNAHVLDILSRQRALNYTPGAQYSYTNSGYNLLAIIVERVSGKPLAQFTKERIFEPLGMSSTQWRDDFTRIVKRRATAYAARQGGYAIDMPFENAHGNGGLLTTVRDLLVWDHALENGKIGGPRFRETMQQRGRLNDGSEISYAAGLMVGSYNAVAEVSHTGATGGYRAFLGRYPAQRISVAMLCNAGDADRGSAGRRIADAFLGAAAPAVAQPSPPQAGSARPAYTPDQASLLAYAGEYYSPDAEVALVVEVDNGRLVARRRPDTRITLTPVEQDVFQAGPFGRIGFLRDGAGRVTQLSVRQARVFDLRFDRTNQP